MGGCILLVIFTYALVRHLGDRRGVAGCSTLGGGSTLVGVAVGDIFGVGGIWGVGTRPVSSYIDLTFCGSEIYTLLVYFDGEIGGVRG